MAAMVNTMSTSMLEGIPCDITLSKTVCPRESSLARKLCGKSASHGSTSGIPAIAIQITFDWPIENNVGQTMP